MQRGLLQYKLQQDEVKKTNAADRLNAKLRAVHKQAIEIAAWKKDEKEKEAIEKKASEDIKINAETVFVAERKAKAAVENAKADAQRKHEEDKLTTLLSEWEQAVEAT